MQTRKQEITELEYSKLSEDEKRLYTRILVNNKNKYLFVLTDLINAPADFIILTSYFS